MKFSIKPTTQNIENLDKQLNANAQVKKLDNSSEAITKSSNSLERKAETEKIIALDLKYAQMERDLSGQILDLKQQLSDLLIESKEKMSYTNNEADLKRVYDETRKEAERLQKQILEINEKLTLIKAKRQLLPLTAIREK